MTARPIAIDAFCCEGAGSSGLAAAGFDVYGIDLFKWTDRKGIRRGFSRARYPFPAWQGDAIIALALLEAGHALPFTALDGTTTWLAAEDVDLWAGSPPCQHASAGTRAMRASGDDRHPALIEPTRDLFEALGGPYIIENVSGAALRDPVTLCWSMFHDPHQADIRNEDGVLLRMERHRLFESNLPLTAPGPCDHDPAIQVAGAYGAAQRTIAGAKRRGGGYVPGKAIQEALLGVSHPMTEGGLHQCLPPVYTEHLGRQALALIQAEEVAA